MKKNEFTIGQRFFCGSREWLCTDVGTRVVVAIKVDTEAVEDASWLNGPPYALLETVFDENDFEGCSLTPDLDI